MNKFELGNPALMGSGGNGGIGGIGAKEVVGALRGGTETCAECQHYGEPCGCNRPDGECDGWYIGQAAADLIESLKFEIEQREP